MIFELTRAINVVPIISLRDYCQYRSRDRSVSSTDDHSVSPHMIRSYSGLYSVSLRIPPKHVSLISESDLILMNVALTHNSPDLFLYSGLGSDTNEKSFSTTIESHDRILPRKKESYNS